MFRKIFFAFMFAVALAVAGCDDDDGDGGFKPEEGFRELTSPENVLYNLQMSYNERDCDHFVPLLHDAFMFVFAHDDLPDIPPDLLQTWSKLDELDATNNMMDPDFTPCDPRFKVTSMEMTLELSEDLGPCRVQGAPPGTLYGRVSLELVVRTVDAITLDVRSRPHLYFSPDSTHAATTGVTWQLWRVEDSVSSAPPPYQHSASWREGAPWIEGHGTVGVQGLSTASFNRVCGAQAPLGKAPCPVEQPTWGLVKTLYVSTCD